MRDTCYQCVRKHLGEAAVYEDEIVLGYPQFMLRLIGCLSHAAIEAAAENKELADTIRNWRLEVERYGLPATRIPYDGFSEYLDVCIAAVNGKLSVPAVPDALKSKPATSSVAASL